jgi:hypothetical protein
VVLVNVKRMNLNARLVSLEARYKRVLACPWCRSILVQLLAQKRNKLNEKAEEILRTKCWYCGTQFNLSLAGLDEHEREVRSIIFNSHPSKRFNDERVHAVFVYAALRRSQERNKSHSSAQRVKNVSLLTAAQQKRMREREEIEKAGSEFLRIQTVRMKRIAKGPNTFPIDQTLKEIETACQVHWFSDRLLEIAGINSNHSHRFELEKRLEPLVFDLRILKQRVVCEEVIWGFSLTKTLHEIESLEKDIDSEVDNAINLHEEEIRMERAKAEAVEGERLQQLEVHQKEMTRLEDERARVPKERRCADDQASVLRGQLSNEWRTIYDRLATEQNEAYYENHGMMPVRHGSHGRRIRRD